jgi:hypothetical protein
MRNLSVKTVREVTADFSPDQWELYTNLYDRSEMEYVATKLNEALSNLTSDRTNNKVDVELAMHDVMKIYSKYGALDSEPIRFLERVLDEIY